MVSQPPPLLLRRCDSNSFIAAMTATTTYRAVRHGGLQCAEWPVSAVPGGRPPAIPPSLATDDFDRSSNVAMYEV